MRFLTGLFGKSKTEETKPLTKNNDNDISIVKTEIDKFDILNIFLKINAINADCNNFIKKYNNRINNLSNQKKCAVRKTNYKIISYLLDANNIQNYDKNLTSINQQIELLTNCSDNIELNSNDDELPEAGFNSLKADIDELIDQYNKTVNPSIEQITKFATPLNKRLNNKITDKFEHKDEEITKNLILKSIVEILIEIYNLLNFKYRLLNSTNDNFLLNEVFKTENTDQKKDDDTASTTSTISTNTTTSFKKGDKICGNYRGQNKYYPATISQVNTDGTYNLSYNDGDQEQKVLEQNICEKCDETSKTCIISGGDKKIPNYFNDYIYTYKSGLNDYYYDFTHKEIKPNEILSQELILNEINLDAIHPSIKFTYGDANRELIFRKNDFDSVVIKMVIKPKGDVMGDHLYGDEYNGGKPPKKSRKPRRRLRKTRKNRKSRRHKLR